MPATVCGCYKPVGDVHCLVLFLIDLVDGVQVAAAGCAAEDIVRHLVLDD